MLLTDGLCQVGWEEKVRQRTTGNTSSARDRSGSYLKGTVGRCTPEIKTHIVQTLKRLGEKWLTSMASYNHKENQGPTEQAAGIQVRQGSGSHIEVRGSF